MRTIPESLGRMQAAGFRLHQDERGKALVEYALLLGMVVGSLAIAADSLGLGGSRALGRLTGQLGAAEARSAARTWAGAKLGFAASGRTATSHRAAGVSRHTLLVFAAAGALLLATVGVNFLHGRKRRRLLHEHDEARPGVQIAAAKLQARYVAKRKDIFRGIAGDVRRLLHNQVIVEQIMSRPTGQAGPEATVGELATLMRDRQTHHVLICSPAGELLGVVSDRDLSQGEDQRASEVMARAPLTTTPDALVSLAVSLMLEHRISSLPVVRNGVLTGIVTMSDIAMTLQCTLQIIEQMLQTLDHCGEAGLPDLGRESPPAPARGGAAS